MPHALISLGCKDIGPLQTEITNALPAKKKPPEGG
jgi:hypothetical protein